MRAWMRTATSTWPGIQAAPAGPDHGPAARMPFVRKYDASGNESGPASSALTSSIKLTGVAVDASGVYVAGITSGTLPGQTSAGGSTRSCASTTPAATKSGPASSAPASRRIQAVLACVRGRLGRLRGRDHHGALAGPDQRQAATEDAFVRKYDANGNELWTRQFGTATSTSAR